MFIINTDQERITVNLCEKIGEYIAKMHEAHVIHGDLTTSNMMVNKDSLKVMCGLVTADKLYLL